ncbi:hypothetical protein CCR97_08055 [Rhodoplanes elegans]|uniref:Uncharacterized protein n=1 Tax=Rhodoplanes elegans TaxID=29408 RepID=A0A327KPY0_9BRAD|nr:hypothetical protein [Rhodoplanes elegans]MBK5958072.1 hypothetical protein [Rhodoplanes elegans]MBK5958164.1 hypothetical protein [Rhodoplanes elegans]RAI40451.1 hypothetical protein CH338_06305 [Rhodoplanes elegans]
MFTTSHGLISRAVQLGARRPTLSVRLDHDRWENWRASALTLICAWDADAAERAELIECCDRFADAPPPALPDPAAPIIASAVSFWG